MASYQQPAFYSQPPTAFPLTPNPTHDEFSPLAFGGFNEPFGNFSNNFDLGSAGSTQAHGQTSQIPRGPSPTDNTRTGGRSSSEEKELTPGQRRRKEQNRAAQRAFRERKERHVRELESRLASLEQANSRAAAENDKLKEQVEKFRLENRLLHENSIRGNSPPIAPEMGPMEFKPMDPNTFSHQQPPSQFTSPIFGEHPNKGPIHRISRSPKTGEKLLGTGAAWDLIVCHPLYEQGLVDIGDISDRLKGLARCDGQGPVFEESVILEAIHQSSGSGRDELLLDGSPVVGY